jgi:hypothetical protein
MNRVILGFGLVLLSASTSSSARAASSACGDGGDYTNAACTFENDEIQSCAFKQNAQPYHCLNTPGKPGYCYREKADRKVYRVSSGNSVRLCQVITLKDKSATPRCSVELRDCPFLSKGKKTTSLLRPSIKVSQNALADPTHLQPLNLSLGTLIPYAYENEVVAAKTAFPPLAVTGKTFHIIDTSVCRKIQLDADGEDQYDAAGKRIEQPAPELSAQQCCVGGQAATSAFRYETREEYWGNFCTLEQSTVKKGVPNIVSTKTTPPKAVKFRGKLIDGVEVQYLTQ